MNNYSRHSLSLLLFSISILNPIYASQEYLIKKINPGNKNTMVKNFSNETESHSFNAHLSRTIDVPTSIIRMKGDISALKLSCDEVINAIETNLVRPVNSKQFTYNTLVFCGYDPETDLAINFMINSYLDPLSDDAVSFLKDFIAQKNGTDLLGTPINIEEAQGLVIANNITAGWKNKPDSTTFTEYKQDRSNFYFKSNYEMRKTFIADIYDQFYSNDPEKIIPFLNKWIFDSAGAFYAGILRESNYVELQPERIFIMKDGEPIFVSLLKYYFAHNCNRHENQRCLNR